MKITNKNIVATINFVDQMSLKGRGSLGRTKLKEVLIGQKEALSKDQISIIDEYDGWTDRDKGQFTQENTDLNSAINDLLNQEIELSYESPFKNDFVKALEDYDGDLTGSDADVFALLYTELVEENKEEEK